MHKVHSHGFDGGERLADPMKPYVYDQLHNPQGPLPGHSAFAYMVRVLIENTPVSQMVSYSVEVKT